MAGGKSGGIACAAALLAFCSAGILLWTVLRAPARQAQPKSSPTRGAARRGPAPDIPRARQAATLSRLFIAPGSGRSVEGGFAATQHPSARGTVPYVLIPDAKFPGDPMAHLAAQGVRVIGRFPPSGILVELDESQFSWAAKDEGFSLVGEWRSTDKISPLLEGHLGRGEREVTIVVCDLADRLGVAKAVAAAGGRTLVRGIDSTGWVRAMLPDDDAPGALATIAALGEVRWIEPSPRLRAMNDFAVKETDLNVETVWNTHGLVGSNQVVAVCDTGLDTGDADSILADFRGRVLDFVDYGGYGCADYAGHGTHVAGSLFGDGANSRGQYKGVAYGAKAVVYGIGDGTSGSDLSFDRIMPTDDEWFDTASWKAVFDGDTAKYGYRIHSDSWGASSTGDYAIYSEGVDAASVANPGLLIAVAAGNRDSYGLLVSAPGTAKNALTVGNCYSSRTNAVLIGCREGTSCHGTEDGRYKPDLMAPGTHIVSARSTLCSHKAFEDTTDYREDTGTSMATPLTAGCAALTREWLWKERGRSEPSSALVKAILTGGTRAMRATEEQGWGCIDLENSLYPTNATVFLYDYVTNATEEAMCIGTFTVTNSSAPLRVQLAWIDPPATEGASLTLVVDHDLIVSNATTGAVFLGNDFDSTGVADTLNNVEGVRIAEPRAGDTYRVYMSGRTTESGFETVSALYVSGAIVEGTLIDATSLYDDAADGTVESLSVDLATVAQLVEIGGIVAEELNSLASNGLRVWENVLLGIVGAGDEEAEDLALAISIENGTPVVRTTIGNLTGLSLENPTMTCRIGTLVATATLQQSDSPESGAEWSTASQGTTAGKCFYRLLVVFAVEDGK